jgi:hypothetical protein
MVDSLDASRVTRGTQYFYAEEALPQKLLEWYRAEILPRVREENRAFFMELFEYDLVTRPIYQPVNARARATGEREFETTSIGEQSFYVRRGFWFNYDIPALYARVLAGERPEFQPHPRTATLYYRTGFANHIDNHEFVSRYVGLTREQVDSQAHAALASAAAAG